MQKDVLLEMVKQNQYTSSFSFDQITEQNAALRLNERTASIGFIYRHIGETINLVSFSVYQLMLETRLWGKSIRASILISAIAES